MTYKVLIVDDSKLARMMTAKALQTLQPTWLYREAANADEAVALADHQQFDLALLDLNMPGRDGLELAAELKQNSPLIELALISANTQLEVVNRARAIGATFLIKPLGMPALETFLTGIEQRWKAAAA